MTASIGALKRALLVLAALLLQIRNGVAAEPVPRILFVGNSYTSFNDLPKMFQEMVAGAGAAKSFLKASERSLGAISG